MASPNLEFPFALIFAGPNGSGKTSLIEQIQEGGLRALGGLFPVPEYFINPDQVAKEVEGNFASQDERDQAAQARGIALRREAIERRKSFAFETVMSHPARISEIVRLKEQVYRALLTFIATDDPAINVRRVKERYATKTTTGHWVPPDRVRRRYGRTMRLLPTAAELADAVFVYDNSADFMAPRQVAVADGDDVSAAEECPRWVDRFFLAPLARRAAELERIAAQVGFGFSEPDILGGSYVGRIACSTAHFVAQRLESGLIVVHDRALMDLLPESHLGGAADYSSGQWLRISYEEEHAPVVARLS